MMRRRCVEVYAIRADRVDVDDHPLELRQRVQQITHIPAPRLRIAPSVLKAMAGLLSAVEKIMAVPDDYSAEYLRINAGVTYSGDNAKAKRELGYNPPPAARRPGNGPGDHRGRG
jgi:hypothetical protein